ncbi:isoprenylcysteine carboxyl methyltransferase family protein [Streptococcus equinus]|uniref:Uncharacterized protein YpbQ, isoprenylcysteine carboxyl methyltransferase (ICMT) family n=1 Tax=Streptococcus equinus TaxID=1335 RepID=A0A1G9LGS3_STREI|nr:isoprenylcysteine carboxyl methyltransferase family protein [Streptococcus equinus]SDL61179.1 Uncharacterized protein YpbQ, isoprenylcysteine carboxyl methyltransferase (ICMT) family [Streptococcus equinus]SEI91193.1 Uncharacterized protein YpbQ, isoprenylcysteine carboxyl methyltransferase (ICMT) family [Streptococcus equinus]
MIIIITIMLSMFFIRLVFLKLSIQNEREILAAGGREYGKQVSKVITLLHILFYFFALSEALLRKVHLDIVGLWGLILMLFSIFMLYTVTRLLGKIWTIKLMIANNHQYVDHWLFRYIKHPNYFLNIAPELIGVALLCHARYTTILILPFYMVAIYFRIRQENYLIKCLILPNGIQRK